MKLNKAARKKLLKLLGDPDAWVVWECRAVLISNNDVALWIGNGSFFFDLSVAFESESRVFGPIERHYLYWYFWFKVIRVHKARRKKEYLRSVEKNLKDN